MKSGMLWLRHCYTRKVFLQSRQFSSLSPPAVESPAPQTTGATLQVSETFRSIQGEGPFSGRPSVFLRLGICNLNCVWCDTPYTWLFSEQRISKVKRNVATHATTKDAIKMPPLFNKQTELRRESVDAVLEEIVVLAGRRTRNVVITGGEPLLHKKPLLDLVPILFDRGYSVEFETNGTISPAGLPVKSHINVSPKLANSLQPLEQRINWKTLDECLSFNSSVLKFVIDGERDLDEATSIVEHLGIARDRVYIMPQGQNRDELMHKALWLAELCQDIGFNYSHRLHVELWGSKRGV